MVTLSINSLIGQLQKKIMEEFNFFEQFKIAAFEAFRKYAFYAFLTGVVVGIMVARGQADKF